MITAVYNIILWFNYIFDEMCSNLHYNLMYFLSLILPQYNLLIFYKGYEPIPVYAYLNLRSTLSENIVYCGGGSESGSEGKGKRNASIENDDSDNKKLLPKGGIPEVTVDDSRNIHLQNLQEVNWEMNKTAEELDSVKKDLKDVRLTITIDNILSQDQKQKNNALQEIKEKYPTFFDEDSGNTTDREGLDQVKQYLQDDFESLQKKHQNLSTKSRNYQSVLDWFNNNGKGGGGSASGSSSGGFTGGGTSSSGPSSEQGSLKNSNNDSGYLESFINKFLMLFSFFAEIISNNMNNFF